MKERVLVLAPHFDDECFGCLGTLLQHKTNGDDISFLWFTAGDTPRLKAQERGAEKVEKYFKTNGYVYRHADQVLDENPIKEYITEIEMFVGHLKPTIVYIPFIGDLNRDHRIISEAAMVALRPYKFKTPPEVWMYEIPGTTEIGLSAFIPDACNLIDWKLKLRLLKKWYPKELTNGREVIDSAERFERWPRVNRT